MAKGWNMRGGIVAGGISAMVMAAAPAPAAAAQPDQVRAAISAALEQSAAGWNTLNLDLFMGCYEDAPTTTYVSGDAVSLGFKAIRDTYAKRFANGPKAMGQLSLDMVDLRLIEQDHAYVIGRFTLHREGQADISGITTLLFRRTAAGWRIIADHS